MKFETQAFAGETVSAEVQMQALTAFIDRIIQDGPQPLWALEDELATRGVTSADRDDPVGRSRSAAYHGANAILDASHAAGLTASGSEVEGGYILGRTSFDADSADVTPAVPTP